MRHQETDLRHRAETLAGGLPAMLLAAERIAATVAQGVHGRRRVGQGETFWQFRRYQPGDPTPTIDWRQSAKSSHIYVRQMEWEAAQSLWLWCDSSPSMDWRSANDVPLKRDRAAVLALALTVLLVRGGERVALLDSDLPPMTGPTAIDRLTLLLSDLQPKESDPGLPPFKPLPRFAHLVLIGDFLAPIEEIQAAVERHAARGVMGHLLQVLDPAEESLPYSGRVRFEGLEGESPWLLSRVENVRDEYRDRLARQRDNLASLARALGWTVSAHRTDHPAESALLTLYMSLAQRAGE
jgi:uncharacterized protein (DUF58 family)